MASTACLAALVAAFAGAWAPEARSQEEGPALPLVLNTWPFTDAAAAAWGGLIREGSALDAVTEVGELPPPPLLGLMAPMAVLDHQPSNSRCSMRHLLRIHKHAGVHRLRGAAV